MIDQAAKAASNRRYYERNKAKVRAKDRAYRAKRAAVADRPVWVPVPGWSVKT